MLHLINVVNHDSFIGGSHCDGSCPETGSDVAGYCEPSEIEDVLVHLEYARVVVVEGAKEDQGACKGALVLMSLPHVDDSISLPEIHFKELLLLKVIKLYIIGVDQINGFFGSKISVVEV